MLKKIKNGQEHMNKNRKDKDFSGSLFICQQPLSQRAPGCSGKGYSKTAGETICSECKNDLRRRMVYEN